MSTLRLGRNSKIVAAALETNYIWGRTIADAMTLAAELQMLGWEVQGNPSPMVWNGEYGTGVSITRVMNV